MLIIPAIDLVDGACVRLTQGDYSRLKKYYSDPLDVALKFKNDGAEMLHVVDLDGAKTGKISNLDTITTIIRGANIPVQIGGGIRTFEDAFNLLTNGVRRVVLGTSALCDMSLVKRLIDIFGTDRVAVSVDVKDGFVVTNGWTKKSNLKMEFILGELKAIGLEILIFTDVTRDGMLCGVNFDLIKKILEYGFKVIIAGGVCNLNDVWNLKKIGAYGCIIGKALYEEKINLKDACRAVKCGLTKRIVPCMDIKNGRVVKGVNFFNLEDAGDPVQLAKFYSDEGADELVFLDVIATQENRKILYNLVEKISENINIPFTVGGGIQDISDIRSLLTCGADKVSIGSTAVKCPLLVSEAAKIFGSQCIVISIDAKKTANAWDIYINGGRDNAYIDAVSFAKQMENAGAGELLVNSLDKDGTKQGYDIELLKIISESVNIPVIASSGAGRKKDFLDAFVMAKVDAVLAASLFHYGELHVSELKNYLNENNITVRI